MIPRLTVNTTRANAMISELARMTGQPQARVIDHEVGKILEATIRYTPAAQVQKMRSRHDNAEFTQQPADLYDPVRKRRGVKLRKGMVLYNIAEHRYPDALWAKIAARRKARLVKILATRGLAKKSWWNIARSLGINLAVAGFVTRAIAITGRDYPENISVRRVQRGAKVGVSFVNAQPTVQFHGYRALKRAVAGRVKYFEKNLKDGVFNSVRKTASKYPGVKVRA